MLLSVTVLVVPMLAIACAPVVPACDMPEIEITSFGNFLSGTACGVDLNTTRVVVYIEVTNEYGTSWWLKPYWSEPLTKIGWLGTWSCNIQTGGTDWSAQKACAYLVPANYNPASEENAGFPGRGSIASACATRGVQSPPW